jgi:hypothetical protein
MKAFKSVFDPLDLAIIERVYEAGAIARRMKNSKTLYASG